MKDAVKEIELQRTAPAARTLRTAMQGVSALLVGGLTTPPKIEPEAPVVSPELPTLILDSGAVETDLTTQA